VTSRKKGKLRANSADVFVSSTERTQFDSFVSSFSFLFLFVTLTVVYFTCYMCVIVRC
jgi:hypothetical protein